MTITRKNMKLLIGKLKTRGLDKDSSSQPQVTVDSVCSWHVCWNGRAIPWLSCEHFLRCWLISAKPGKEIWQWQLPISRRYLRFPLEETPFRAMLGGKNKSNTILNIEKRNIYPNRPWLKLTFYFSCQKTMTVQNKDNAKSCCSRPTDKI